MFKKLTLAVGFGAGYVLGAKAGRERYTQLESKFREVAGMPAVQNATANVKDAASGMAESAKATVNDKVEVVTDKAGSAKDDSDKTGSDKDGSDPTVDLRGSGPMAGAAASVTAPDNARS